MSSEKRMDANLRKRMRRRLYYGDMANLDDPSLPLTELTVEYFKESVEQKLGHVDLDVASDLVKKNRVSPCSMVLSMMYAKRLRQRNTEYLGSISSSDVFFISMMMASKYMYDEGVDEEVFNDEWAENTEQEVDDVNQMEIDFLQAIDWSLFVRPDEFEETLTNIERRLALKEGLRRGWFTYSELAVLADMSLITSLWTNVGLECSKVTAVLSAAYVTSLLSLLGSTAIAAQVSGPLSSAMVTAISTQLAPLAMSSWQALPPCVPSVLNPEVNMWPDAIPNGDFDNKHAVRENETQAKKTTGAFNDGQVDESTVAVGVDCHASVSGNPVNGAGYQGDPTDDAKVPQGQKAKSSLLSIWFLDSFLSQLWSVTSEKPRCRDDRAQQSQVEGDGAQGSPRCGSCSRRRRRLGSHHLSSTESDVSADSFNYDRQNLASAHGNFEQSSENRLQDHSSHGRLDVEPHTRTSCTCGLPKSQASVPASDYGYTKPRKNCCLGNSYNKDSLKCVLDFDYLNKITTDFPRPPSLWSDPSKASCWMAHNSLKNHLSASLVSFHSAGLPPAIEVT